MCWENDKVGHRRRFFVKQRTHLCTFDKYVDRIQFVTGNTTLAGTAFLCLWRVSINCISWRRRFVLNSWLGGVEVQTETTFSASTKARVWINRNDVTTRAYSSWSHRWKVALWFQTALLMDNFWGLSSHPAQPHPCASIVLVEKNETLHSVPSILDVLVNLLCCVKESVLDILTTAKVYLPYLQSISTSCLCLLHMQHSFVAIFLKFSLSKRVSPKVIAEQTNRVNSLTFLHCTPGTSDLKETQGQ